MNSILPGNLPINEREIESLENRISDLDVPIDRLWNPATCPENILPFLAWALSVDVWNPQWSVEQKRSAVAAAPQLHRIKGTPKAVKMALTQLGLDYEYTEWHEQTPQGAPGTFAITVFINNNLDGDLLGAKNQALIQELINKNKRATAHYTFTMGLGIDGPLQIGGAIEPMQSHADLSLTPSYTMNMDVQGVFAGGLYNTLTLDLTIG